MAKNELPRKNPAEFIIDGKDNDTNEDSPFWQTRAFRNPSPELMAGIGRMGVLSPIIVKEDEEGGLHVIDGRQRVMACRELNKQLAANNDPAQVTVPYIVMNNLSNVDIMNVSAMANELRISDDVLDKAQGVARHIRLTGMQPKDVAEVFGVSVTTIYNWQKLAAASPKLHAAMKEKNPDGTRKIAGQAAVEIAKMDSIEKQEAALADALKKAANSGRGTVSQSAAKSAAIAGGRSGGSSATSARASGGGKTKGESPGRARSHQQAGIKRQVLRDMIETEAAKKLEESNLKVMKWFANGEGNDSDWFIVFAAEAEAELIAKKEELAKKKAEEAAARKAERDAAKAAAKDAKEAGSQPEPTPAPAKPAKGAAAAAAAAAKGKGKPSAAPAKPAKGAAAAAAAAAKGKGKAK